MSVRHGDSSDERVLDLFGISSCRYSVKNVEDSHVVEVQDVFVGVHVSGGRKDVSVHRLIVEECNSSRFAGDLESNWCSDESSEVVA